MAAPAPSPPAEGRSRAATLVEAWGYRAGAAIVIVAFVLALQAAMPLSERGFISPDDGDALRYSDAVRHHGRPLLSADEVAPPGGDVDLYKPPGTFETPRGDYATVRPPALFYLLAVPAAWGAHGVL